MDSSKRLPSKRPKLAKNGISLHDTTSLFPLMCGWREGGGTTRHGRGTGTKQKSEGKDGKVLGCVAIM